MNARSFVVVVLAALPLAGCATSQSGAVYSRDQARQEHAVREGVVESVRQVTIEGTRSGIGAAAGAAVGGIGGSSIGHGKGASAAAVVGAVAGGVAGQAIEEATTQRAGLEITVRLDNGELRAVVQEADEKFHPGERVRLISGGGVTRVSH